MGQPIKMGTGLFDIIDTTKTVIRETTLKTSEVEAKTTVKTSEGDFDKRSVFSQRSQKAQTSLETSVKPSPKKRVKFTT